MPLVRLRPLVAALAFVAAPAVAQDAPIAEATGQDAPPAPSLPDEVPAPTPPPTLPVVTAPEPAPAPSPTVTTPPERTAPAGVAGGYKDGLWFGTADEKWKLKFGGLLQGRWEYETTDLAPENTTSSFQVRRAQIKLGGHVGSPAASFAMETEFGQGFPFLKDGYANYAFIPAVLEVRVGQWKKPYSRLELTSDSKLGFLERAQVNAFFNAGRDIGVAVHNDVTKSPMVEYALGLFSGASDKPSVVGETTVDVDAAPGPFPLQKGRLVNFPKLMTPTLVARLGYNFGDVKGYNELDMDGGPLRFGVAGSVVEAFDNGLDQQRGASRAEVDGIVKAYGVAASAAVYVGLDQTGETTFEQEYQAVGGHAQVGYLIAGLSHPAVRFDYISVDGDDNDLIEAGLAHTLLVFGQNMQWQADASALWTQVPGGYDTSWRLRTQLAAAF